MLPGAAVRLDAAVRFRAFTRLTRRKAGVVAITMTRVATSATSFVFCRETGHLIELHEDEFLEIP